jgi:hypothetical protein
VLVLLMLVLVPRMLMLVTAAPTRGTSRGTSPKHQHLEHL